ncbi:MAG: acyl--CoA ligase, partial [Oscillospiraceae bacterium]|nr:acyl--CoA ligase [Oscillospiraceae bacterium]
KLMYQVGSFLTNNANVSPDRIVMIHNDKSYTYFELNKIVNRVANYLHEKMGLERNDRISYLFRNGTETVFIFWAAQKLGVAAVPLNIRLTGQELINVVDDSDASVFIYDGNMGDQAKDVIDNCGAVIHIACQGTPCEEGHVDFQDMLNYENDAEPDVDVQPEDGSLILFTGGTTGRSKGVLRSQFVIRDYSLMLAIENSACNRPDVMITSAPLFHNGGFVSMLKCFALAGTFIPIEGTNPPEILGLIEKYKATNVFLIPPTLFQKLAEYPDMDKYDLSSVIEGNPAGGKSCLDYVNAIFKLFPNAVARLTYGSTEICSPMGAPYTREFIAEHPELASSCGNLNVLWQCRLVDDQGNDVPDGEVGEAIFKGSMVLKGYLNAPEADKKLFDKDGWFHSEDMMVRTPEGLYTGVDRKKDMIKTGGENVYAQEVENVLRDYPAIKDCAVIGVPDKKFIEAVAAAVTLSEGAALDIDDLMDYCRNKMAGYKKPRYIAIMDEIPKNALGKMQKKVLRENAANLFKPIFESKD